MKPKDFELTDGKVVYWDMLDLDFAKELKEQLDELKEDLAQVTFKNGEIILDIGWYPEFSRNGVFVVSVIQNENWEEPLFQGRCKNLEKLKLVVQQGVFIARVGFRSRSELPQPA